MTRPHSARFRLFIAAALAIGAAMGAGSAMAGQNDYAAPTEMLFDHDITSDLSAVPEFAAVHLERPYTMRWQTLLLEDHARFVATLQAGSVPATQTKTGSISDPR